MSKIIAATPILLPGLLVIALMITSVLVMGAEDDAVMLHTLEYIALLLPPVFFLIFAFELKERKQQYVVLTYAAVYVVLYYLSFEHYFVLYVYFILAYLALLIAGFLIPKSRD